MEPLRPSEADCCNSGCNPCILDVYEQQLEKYLKKQLTTAVTSNCMSLTTYTSFRLVKVVPHTQDTFLYTFEHDVPGTSLIYKPGQHFLLKGCRDDNGDNEFFTKAYTPIFRDDSHSFTILVKLYRAGRMSNYFKGLTVNDVTSWRGPYGDYDVEYNHRFMLLIGQGTGIAPLYAIINDMLRNDDCDTFLKLFLCCRSERDLVLRDCLYELTSAWNFTYELFLSECGSENVGKYNEIVNPFRLRMASLSRYFVECSGTSDVRVLVCGSVAFADDVVVKLIGCGVESGRIFRF